VRGSANVTLVECAITGHNGTATEFYYGGAGLRVDANASVHLVHCTIAGNRASAGGGVYVQNMATVAFDRCILWGNCASDAIYGDEGYVEAGGALVFECCDTDPTRIKGPGTRTYWGGIVADPQFCNRRSCLNAPTPEGDYRLNAGSPALNVPGCGQIGVFGVGCGVTAVERTSWGKLKGLYR